MGRGRVGVKELGGFYLVPCFPLPFIPSRQGRGQDVSGRTEGIIKTIKANPDSV